MPSKDKSKLFREFVYGGIKSPTFPFDSLAEGLAELIIATKSRNKKLRIFDLGCGSGELSKRIFKKIQEKNTKGIPLEVVALDCNKDMLKCYNKEMADCFASFKQPGDFKITPIKKNFTPKLKLAQEKFDVILAFFFFHHQLDSWRMAVDHAATLLKNNGLVVLSEIAGDYGGWSECFHQTKVKNSLEEDNNQQRVNVLSFMRRCHEYFKKHKWLNNQIVSASEVKPICNQLLSQGFTAMKPLEVSYDQEVDVKIWIDEIGKDEPLFSKIPNRKHFEALYNSGKVDKIITGLKDDLYFIAGDDKYKLLTPKPTYKNLFRLYSLCKVKKNKLSSELLPLRLSSNTYSESDLAVYSKLWHIKEGTEDTLDQGNDAAITEIFNQDLAQLSAIPAAKQLNLLKLQHFV